MILFEVMIGIVVLIGGLGLIAETISKKIEKKFNGVINEKYGNVIDFFGEIIKTQKNDWKIEKETLELENKLFPDLEIIFEEKDLLYHLTVKYESLDIYKIVTEYNYALQLDKSMNVKKLLKEQDKLFLEETVNYLHDVYQLIKKEEKEKLKGEKKIKAETLKEELEMILASSDVFSAFKASNIFMIQMENNENFTTIKVTLKNKPFCYMIFHYDQFNEEFDASFSKAEETEIFKEKYYEIQSSLRKIAEENKSTSSNIEGILKNNLDIETNFRTEFKGLQVKLENLKDKENWLGNESKHYLNNTLPNDLVSLFHIYANYDEKEELGDSLKETLSNIDNKLSMLEKEAKENQKLQFETKRVVIAKR